jgi:deoxyhypusine synthase
MKQKHVSLKGFLGKMQKLEPLNLAKCATVGELVDGMSRCSFGARMLGDVAATLVKWATAKEKAVIIFGGDLRVFGPLLQEATKKGWFSAVESSESYLAKKIRSKRALIVGDYTHAEELHAQIDELIFVNPDGRCRPGQIKDGYFPNVVFADPGFIIPILWSVLRERLDGVKVAIMAGLKDAARFGPISHEVFRAVHVWEAMQRDKDCTVFMTLSGAMTVAQQSLLICDMIEKERVDCIASTGALMAHGLIAGVGLSHYKYDPSYPDSVLATLGMNRVTDTLEPETNFDHIDDVMNAVLWDLEGKDHSPAHLHSAIGKYLSQHPQFGKVRGILRAAYEHKVPVVVPAFHDSEIGNDHFTHNLLRKKKGLAPLIINQELDTAKLLELFTGARRLGIISIGGGVPRNHIQNLAPLTEIINSRKAAKLPVKKFMYGCRIDPQLPWHGGMGGCTYEENMSWRKFFLKASTAQLKMDASIAWPFIQKGLDEQMD